MTAIAYAQPSCRPAHTGGAVSAAAAQSPVGLRLAPPMAAPARLPAPVYRRRRLLAALLLCSVLALAWLALAALGVGPLPGPERQNVAGSVYVVQPGDTLWSIARGIRPGGDVRPVVDRLVAANGGAELQVGERITLPAD